MTGSGLIANPERGLEVISSPSAAVLQQLALDERLAREAGSVGRSVIRFWWGAEPMAVLGCADKPEIALDLAECERLGIEHVKRVTGGGAVLQCAGVFNYSYTAPDPGRLDIHRVFKQGADLVVGALSRLGVDACHRGISDVAVGERKISGSAQARKWKAVLLHGTLLADMDFDLLDAVLRHPLREPDYRRGRSHRDFLTSLMTLGVGASAGEIESAFALAAADVFRAR